MKPSTAGRGTPPARCAEPAARLTGDVDHSGTLNSVRGVSQNSLWRSAVSALDVGPAAAGQGEHGLEGGLVQAGGRIRASAVVDEDPCARSSDQRSQRGQLVALTLDVDEHVQFGQHREQVPGVEVVVGVESGRVEGDAQDAGVFKSFELAARHLVRQDGHAAESPFCACERVEQAPVVRRVTGVRTDHQGVTNAVRVEDLHDLLGVAHFLAGGHIRRIDEGKRFGSKT
jgi:hypothetical protein